jgi:hypothetical protein
MELGKVRGMDIGTKGMVYEKGTGERKGNRSSSMKHRKVESSNFKLTIYNVGLRRTFYFELELIQQVFERVSK